MPGEPERAPGSPRGSDAWAERSLWPPWSYGRTPSVTPATRVPEPPSGVVDNSLVRDDLPRLDPAPASGGRHHPGTARRVIGHAPYILPRRDHRVQSVLAGESARLLRRALGRPLRGRPRPPPPRPCGRRGLRPRRRPARGRGRPPPRPRQGPGRGGPPRGAPPPPPPARGVPLRPRGGGPGAPGRRGARGLRRLQPAPRPRAQEARHPGRLLRLAAGVGVAPRQDARDPGERRAHGRDLPLRGAALPRGAASRSPSWATRSSTSCVPRTDRAAFLAAQGLDPARPVVAVLPGSRPQEVRTTSRRSRARCASSGRGGPTSNSPSRWPPASTRGLFDRDLAGLPVARVAGRTHALLGAASAGIVASGTATVEAALMDLPMVVVYRLSPLTYALGRPLVRVPHYAMANLHRGTRGRQGADSGRFPARGGDAVRSWRCSRTLAGGIACARASPKSARASDHRAPPPGRRRSWPTPGRWQKSLTEREVICDFLRWILGGRGRDEDNRLRRRHWALLLVGCHTITEELPTQPTKTPASPILTVPIPKIPVGTPAPSPTRDPDADADPAPGPDTHPHAAPGRRRVRQSLPPGHLADEHQDPPQGPSTGRSTPRRSSPTATIAARSASPTAAPTARFVQRARPTGRPARRTPSVTRTTPAARGRPGTATARSATGPTARTTPTTSTCSGRT